MDTQTEKTVSEIIFQGIGQVSGLMMQEGFVGIMPTEKLTEIGDKIILEIEALQD